MKRNIYLTIIIALLLFVQNSINAQVTIGSDDEPDSGALLDLKENINGRSTKGLLLPRVKLINLTNPSPLLQHVEGIMVYNLQTTSQLSPGLYKNDGTKWVRMQLPENGTEGQVLELDPVTMAPRWVTKYIPPADDPGAYVLTKGEAILDTNGAILDHNYNYGGVEYTEGVEDLADGWVAIVQPIQITNVTTTDNKLMLFLQTTLAQPAYPSGDFLSYAAGIFINDEDGNNPLVGVRMSVITSTSSGSAPVTKTETLFFVLENLPIGNSTINIAFKRRTPSPNAASVPDLYIGRNMVHNGETTTGSTSLSYEFYEKKQ
ncbi:MAG: hypothetical protein LBU84_01310 [Prevotella sp.]|jgi:hypothetical protein|nr:hypothetical protein [Prevotella sp.]